MKHYEVRCDDCKYVAPFTYRNPEDAEATRKAHLLVNPEHKPKVVEI